ncbi:hypothetical protein [Spirosoma rigui]|uniref:hypothetical protein n=1 Tax=Spirosoma rigui TaxID=564064 RepID=UPI0009AF2DC5|nr:hypothetical protein [Spirosoma rigui]
MSKSTNSIKTIIGKLFPKSEKAISEKLSTDDFNAFSADAEELQNRLDAQEEGNSAEQTDRQKAEAKVTELSDKLTAAESQVTDLSGKLKTALAEKQDLADQKEAAESKITEKDDYITKLKASINPLGDDESNKADASDDFQTDTDKAAIAAYNKSNPTA